MRDIVVQDRDETPGVTGQESSERVIPSTRSQRFQQLPDSQCVVTKTFQSVSARV